MPTSVPTAGQLRNECLMRRCDEIRSSLIGLSSLTIIVLAGIVLSTQQQHARADNRAQDGPKAAETPGSGPSRFAEEAVATLQRLHEQIVQTADRALATVELDDRVRHDSENQRLTVQSAEANWQNAKLTREVAEIAVVEYDEGLFPKDKVNAEGQLVSATSDFNKAVALVERAKDQLAKINRASAGSATDLANQYIAEDRVKDAENQRDQTKYRIADAQRKLKLLLKREKPRRVRERRGAVEQAHADELSKQANFQHETAGLQRSQELSKSLRPSDQERRALGLLDRAIPIEEQVRTRLKEVAGERTTSPMFQKDILDLIDQMQVLVNQAQDQENEAGCRRLKASVHAAADRYPIKDGWKIPATVPGGPSFLAIQARRALRVLHDRIVKLADPVLARVDQHDRLARDAVNQPLNLESAEASAQNTTHRRELAERACLEYDDDLEQQKAATAEVLARAQRGLEQASANLKLAQERCAWFKTTKKVSTTDIANEYAFALILLEAELEQKKATSDARTGEATLQALSETTGELGLGADVERARGEELGAKAGLLFEQSRLMRMQSATGPPARDRRILALLDRAIPIEEQLRARLGEISGNGKADTPLPNEIRDMMSQVVFLVSQAQGLEDEAESERLRLQVHQAASR
jgi:hypothetical protein